MNTYIGTFNGFKVVQTSIGGYVAKVEDGTPVFYGTTYRAMYQWCLQNTPAAINNGIGQFILKTSNS